MPWTFFLLANHLDCIDLYGCYACISYIDTVHRVHTVMATVFPNDSSYLQQDIILLQSKNCLEKVWEIWQKLVLESNPNLKD